jgi:hypothetical protein
MSAASALVDSRGKAPSEWDRAATVESPAQSLLAATDMELESNTLMDGSVMTPVTPVTPKPVSSGPTARMRTGLESVPSITNPSTSSLSESSAAGEVREANDGGRVDGERAFSGSGGDGSVEADGTRIVEGDDLAGPVNLHRSRG